MHEFFHALGAYHEHARYDRDKYVVILYDNVEEGAEQNFERQSVTNMNLYNTEYSYESIMHYGGKVQYIEKVNI